MKRHLLAVVAALTLANTNAFADEPSTADLASARQLGQDGFKLADEGNCKGAIDKLARAEKIFHAPTTATRLGECLIETGKILDGTEILYRVVRETLPANAPPVFADAQERAKKVYLEAKARLANLKIAVAAPSDAQVTVKVDEVVIPSANLNTNRPIDPGEHVVEATAPGYKTARAQVRLADGAVDSVALTMEIDPNAPKPPPGAALSAGGSTSDHPTEGGSLVPAFVGWGVGVVGVGLGTVFGVMASSETNKLDDTCTTNKVCPVSAQDSIDKASTLATVSTVGFIVGAVGLVAGTYFFVARPGAKKSALANLALGRF